MYRLPSFGNLHLVREMYKISTQLYVDSLST